MVYTHMDLGDLNIFLTLYMATLLASSKFPFLTLGIILLNCSMTIQLVSLS